jgi:hypothetical protein
MRTAFLVSTIVLFSACTAPSGPGLTTSLTPTGFARQSQSAQSMSHVDVADAVRAATERLFFKPAHVNVVPGRFTSSMVYYTRGLSVNPQRGSISCDEGSKLAFFLGDPILKGGLQGQGVFVQAPNHIPVGTRCKLVETASGPSGPALTAMLHVTVVRPPS